MVAKSGPVRGGFEGGVLSGQGDKPVKIIFITKPFEKLVYSATKVVTRF